MQHIMENKIDLACISEPYNPTGNGMWLTDETKLAAIFMAPSYRSNWKALHQKDGYIMMRTQNYVFGSCYFSPNRPIGEFRTFLTNLYFDIIPHLSNYVILVGDFNARSTMWQDTRTCPRGELLSAWADEVGMILLNQDSEPINSGYYMGIKTLIQERRVLETTERVCIFF